MSTEDFESIYIEYERELKAFIYAIARRDIYISEDILQNTMINAYQFTHTLKDEKKLKSWLYSIARNEATRYFKSKEAKLENLTSMYSDIANILNYDSNLTEDDISIDIVSSAEFMRLVEKLTVNEQTILLLRYRYGYKLHEIAEMQNEKRNTIKIIHFRATNKLKNIVEREARLEQNK